MVQTNSEPRQQRYSVRAAKLGPEKGKEAVLAHQLLWAAPELLFRPTLRDMDNKGQSGISAAELAADGGESTQAAIRERLAKAVGGKWLELAKELVDDTIALSLDELHKP